MVSFAHAHLSAQLFFPLEALYEDIPTPLTRLVHYIFVVRLVKPSGSASLGILCQVAGIPDAEQLPLVEIAPWEDHPNCQPIDDFAWWFVNCC